jgi:sec-independent protein translocase protein TatA
MLNLTANLMGIEQWLIMLVIVLVLFGGKKIPELLRGVGRGVGELQKGLDEGKRAMLESAEQAKLDQSKTEFPKPEETKVK